jgi:hypothetical protein
MHHEEIELNFDASCQQILGLESEILWEARSSSSSSSGSIEINWATTVQADSSIHHL